MTLPMSRNLLVTALLSVGVVANSACPSPSHPTPEYEGEPPPPREETTGEEVERPPVVPHGAVEAPFLFRVEGAEQPSYLFGTIHVGVSLEEALPGDYFEALASPRAIMIELDPAGVSPQELANLARLPRRTTLDSMLSAVIWHDLVEELQNDMEATGLKATRPWFVMSMLTNKRVRALHEDAPPTAMDASIANYARQQDIELIALETVADQARALNAVPNEQFAALLSEMIDDPEAATEELRTLLQVYRVGDESGMQHLIFDPADVGRLPEMYRELFDRRNARWLPRVKAQLDQGGAFIAVGLGHLLGPNGLVATLRNEGYAIARH